MRVAVAGSSGLIGSELAGALVRAGHEVVRIVRQPPGPGEIRWDPEAGWVDAAAIEGLDAVVNLAGESIGGKLRWDEAHKRRVRDSRVKGTSALAQAMAAAGAKPATFLNGSAIGFYGDRGDDVLTETSPPGTGFVADLCRDWEAATAPAADAGIRVVLARTGLVLSTKGGLLDRLLLPARAGLSARLGHGRQYMSWISLDDEIAALMRLLEGGDAEGAYNLTAPNPVTNAEFTKTLARVLRRPAFLTAPTAALRLALGESAAELLASQRVLPERLTKDGFAFAHTELEEALRALLRP